LENDDQPLDFGVPYGALDIGLKTKGTVPKQHFKQQPQLGDVALENLSRKAF
jgi:hypothetical protein